MKKCCNRLRLRPGVGVDSGRESESIQFSDSDSYSDSDSGQNYRLRPTPTPAPAVRGMFSFDALSPTLQSPSALLHVEVQRDSFAAGHDADVGNT